MIGHRTWPECLDVRNASNGQLELWIEGEIGRDWLSGEGTTARAVVDEIKAFPGLLRVISIHLASPGGSLWDALALFNFLRQHSARIDVVVEGDTAAAATVVAMAGSGSGGISIRERSFIFVVDPRMTSVGTATQHRRAADLLDKIADSMAAVYANRPGITRSRALELMAGPRGEGTWLSASEALYAGLVDGVLASPRAPLAAARRPVADRKREILALVRARLSGNPAPLNYERVYAQYRR